MTTEASNTASEPLLGRNIRAFAGVGLVIAGVGGAVLLATPEIYPVDLVSAPGAGPAVRTTATTSPPLTITVPPGGGGGGPTVPTSATTSPPLTITVPPGGGGGGPTVPTTTKPIPTTNPPTKPPGPTGLRPPTRQDPTAGGCPPTTTCATKDPFQ